MSTHLSQTMESLHEMQSVDLQYSSIDDDGAIAVADALKMNTSVTKINLSWNKFSDEGATALAGALRVNTTVTKIDLTHNEIGVEGVVVFF
jgi:Ran GTPase-activating protein (RanGAP) involved in mRNA processing and transport